jgi:hypothetical protein
MFSLDLYLRGNGGGPVRTGWNPVDTPDHEMCDECAIVMTDGGLAHYCDTWTGGA